MQDGGDKKKVVGSCSLAATPARKQGGTIIVVDVKDAFYSIAVDHAIRDVARWVLGVEPGQERICVQIYTASVQTLRELRISFFWRGEEMYET